MFWDGTRWVDERPAGRQRLPYKRTLGDVVATIPILLLIPLLVLPYLAVNASAALLSITGEPVAGSSITVNGSGLGGRHSLQLTWDGSTARMPKVRTDARGTFQTQVTIPASAGATQHVLAAIAASSGRVKQAALGGATREVLASVTVTVVEAPEPETTPDPTPQPAEPTPKPEPDPTAAPATPTPEPDPTATPKPDPTPTLRPDPTATPKPDPTPTPKPDPTADPTPKPDPTPTPKPDPTPTPQTDPTPDPGSDSTVRVDSIPELLDAVADNSVTQVVVENGTYQVSSAGALRSNSLWIGSRFADRTRPILVRAETPGGVIFDGGGATYFVGIWFSQGAHDQTWDGFVFADGTPTKSGVVFFGERGAAPHHITMRNTKISRSITDSAAGPHDHAFYFSSGAHHITVEDFEVDGRGGLDAAFHFFHTPGARDLIIRRGRVIGTEQAILLGEASNARITFADVRIEGATLCAVSYWAGTEVTFRRVESVNSGGFRWQAGAIKSNVTFVDSNFN